MMCGGLMTQCEIQLGTGFMGIPHTGASITPNLTKGITHEGIFRGRVIELREVRHTHSNKRDSIFSHNQVAS